MFKLTEKNTAFAAVHPKAVVLLLLIHRLFLLPMFCVVSMFLNAVLGVLSSFAIISLRKRELVALLKLCSCSHVAVVFCVSSLRCRRLVCNCGIS